MAQGKRETEPKKVFALADANNFYVSCERVFNYRLLNRPVAVLSNNDGCIIARSNELKALNVKMGTPYFKCRDLLKQHRAAVLSSNYALYADLSNRMHNVLNQFSDELERYSIDEGFLQLPVDSHNRNDGLTKFGREIKETVRQWVGIPVSIGIAPTKTLAKLANERAKKDLRLGGVLDLTPLSSEALDELLTTFDVADVWGIGSRRAAFLREHGITNARQLRDASDQWVLKHLTVMGLRTVLELRGTSCIPMELTPPPKKAICCAKSFGRPVQSLDELKEALATYTSRAAEKVRKQNSSVSVLQIFLRTNHFRSGQQAPQYHNSATIKLPQATSYTPELVAYANAALSRLYQSGYDYQKVGVLLTGLTRQSQLQLNMFSSTPVEENLATQAQKQKVMQALDEINSRFGRNTLRVAAAGVGEQSWKMRRNRLSPAYTTNWDDLLIVKA